MKRLIKKSDAVRLSNLGLDPNQILTMIQNTDWQFHPDKLITDIGDEKSIWGAISDDGQYILELYAYNVEFGKKCAIVTCKIENEMPSNNIEVNVIEIDSVSTAKNNIISQGVTTSNGHITFEKSYKAFSDIDFSTEDVAIEARK